MTQATEQGQPAARQQSPRPADTRQPSTAPAAPESIEFESSPELKEIAAALAKAQATIGTAAKDHEARIKSDKANYTYRYSDLANVWDAIREPLSSNGLSVVQLPSANQARVTVVTLLLHESGQWIRGRLTLMAGRPDPQSIGSAITYARRYSLTAILGVATEDDDGAAASKGEHAQGSQHGRNSQSGNRGQQQRQNEQSQEGEKQEEKQQRDWIKTLKAVLHGKCKCPDAAQASLAVWYITNGEHETLTEATASQETAHKTLLELQKLVKEGTSHEEVLAKAIESSQESV